MTEVNMFIEKMLPTMEELLLLGVLTREEIQNILKKRKKFNLTISGAGSKEQHCQYIQYEIALTKLIEYRVTDNDKVDPGKYFGISFNNYYIIYYPLLYYIILFYTIVLYYTHFVGMN
jgi:hypothetical protein